MSNQDKIPAAQLVLDEIVNPVRQELGKKPLKKMPVEWGRVKKIMVSAKNAVKPEYKKEYIDYDLCPIERAISGKSHGACDIAVGAFNIHAEIDSKLDKALAKHLERDEKYCDDEDSHMYKLPPCGVDFVRQVDNMRIGTKYYEMKQEKEAELH